MRQIATLVLYDNAFSPFARKVRMTLEQKGLRFQAIDGLAPAARADLARLNPRIEVPVLRDGDLTVINSSHIVAYLEHRHPDPPVYPADPARRAEALAWERLADTRLDAIVHAVSNGGFGFEAGTEPPALRDAARADLTPIFDELEHTLEHREFVCGALSIADLALFPHVTALRFLDVSFDGGSHPHLLAWYRGLRRVDVCRADLGRIREFLSAARPIQRPAQIVWRSDRIEWVLAHGFDDWFFDEIRAGRVAWPVRRPSVRVPRPLPGSTC